MKWMRLWIAEIFYGTTFQELDITERGIWFSLLVMAGLPPNFGVVEMRDKVAYPIDVLAKVISCNEDVLEKTLKKLGNKSIKKITFLKDNRIKIVNWGKYQTRYQRYYKGKNGNKKSAYICTTEEDVDADGDGDGDGEEKKQTQGSGVSASLCEDFKRIFPHNTERPETVRKYIQGWLDDFKDSEVIRKELPEIAKSLPSTAKLFQIDDALRRRIRFLHRLK